MLQQSQIRLSIVCNQILGFETSLSQMARFLATSLCDEKLVNPDVCDTIIQGVATFVCYPQTLAAIENIEQECKENLMRCLMSAYDKRTWVHTTWILVRFWRVRKFYLSHQQVHLETSVLSDSYQSFSMVDFFSNFFAGKQGSIMTKT